MWITNAVEPFIADCPLGFSDPPPFVLKIIGNSNLWLGIPREIRSSFFSSQHSREFSFETIFLLRNTSNDNKEQETSDYMIFFTWILLWF